MTSFSTGGSGQSSHQRKSIDWKRSKLEVLAANAIEREGIPNHYEIEHKFHKTRRWRFDFAWINERVALEVEGGIWKGKAGAHTSGKGYTANCEKYNTAVCEGWKVLRVTASQIKDGSMIEWLRSMLKTETEIKREDDDPFPVEDPITYI